MAEITFPIGPIHPALKEPERFMITVEGETVVNADIRIGHIHRGIEKLVESRTYIQNLYLTERICGICSFTHTTNFCQATEDILGIAPPPRGLYLRTIVNELERIHSHLLWVGVAGHEMGFDTLFMYSWDDREVVQDILELMTGNRVNYAYNTIGGVRRDLNQSVSDKLLKGMDFLETRMKAYVDIGLNETTILKRTQGIGILKQPEARKYSAVGPRLRACGIAYDVRKADPHAAYGEIPFDVITAETSDVHGQYVVRALETIESIKMVRYMVKNLPAGDIRVKAPRKVPPGEAISRTEAPRGEDIHYLRSNGTDKPDRLRVRTPTMANILNVAHTLKGAQIADVPMIVAGIDPCMGCMDRVLIIDNDKETSNMVDMEELRKYAIEWYKEAPNR
ncbi:MAG: nickel-dependent hydrogenase large subunit [Thermoplasmata archaeon]|nr:nickel-dependent hydrogenase large subunit [Thermoplasmata archaeon]